MSYIIQVVIALFVCCAWALKAEDDVVDFTRLSGESYILLREKLIAEETPATPKQWDGKNIEDWVAEESIAFRKNNAELHNRLKELELHADMQIDGHFYPADLWLRTVKDEIPSPKTKYVLIGETILFRLFSFEKVVNTKNERNEINKRYKAFLYWLLKEMRQDSDIKESLKVKLLAGVLMKYNGEGAGSVVSAFLGNHKVLYQIFCSCDSGVTALMADSLTHMSKISYRNYSKEKKEEMEKLWKDVFVGQLNAFSYIVRQATKEEKKSLVMPLIKSFRENLPLLLDFEMVFGTNIVQECTMSLGKLQKAVGNLETAKILAEIQKTIAEYKPNPKHIWDSEEPVSITTEIKVD